MNTQTSLIVTSPSKATVYELIDPETKQPFYVGCTGQELDSRLRQHIQRALAGNHTPKMARRLRGLLRRGLQPTARLVCHVPLDEALEAEHEHALALLDRGATLCNEAWSGSVGPTIVKSPSLLQVCQSCGDEFDAVRASAKYCSSRCSMAASRSRRGIWTTPRIRAYERTCVICGEAFQASRAAAAVCSSRCQGRKARGLRVVGGFALG